MTASGAPTASATSVSPSEPNSSPPAASTGANARRCGAVATRRRLRMRCSISSTRTNAATPVRTLSTSYRPGELAMWTTDSGQRSQSNASRSANSTAGSEQIIVTT